MTDLVIRQATADDAEAMHALIQAHLSEGHLLPRELDELRRHADRFLVAFLPGQIVACAELAPLSPRVAEVRSLVVDSNVRGIGLASRMVGEIRSEAKARGYETLCAFTHDARFFVRLAPHKERLFTWSRLLRR